MKSDREWVEVESDNEDGPNEDGLLNRCRAILLTEKEEDKGVWIGK